MKIGIDISQIVHSGSGVSVYTKNLVENLLKIDKKNKYVLFFSSLRQSPLREFQSKNFKIPPILLELLWNRLHVLPIEQLIGKIDVFHTSDWLEPPAECPKVTTIHDLAIFKYPESFAPRGGHNIVTNIKRKLEWVKKECDLIICVSKSTQKDVVELLGIPRKKTRVIYEGVSEEFCDFQKTEDRRQKTETIKRKYKIDTEYILSVSTREPRKNLDRLIEAYLTLRSQYSNISLVIVGKYGWGKEERSIKYKVCSIKYLGHVPQEDLPVLYAGAKCFVYPSLYEGFGLPVLEAMSIGCPVVTSNVSSLPEVGDKAAIYCQPDNVESIALAIKKILDLKKEQLEKVRRACLLQASKFSWEKAARETLEAYEEVYQL